MSDRPLTRNECIKLLRGNGYTGSVSVSVPRLREMVVEICADPSPDVEPASSPEPVSSDQGRASSSDSKYHQSTSTSSDPTLSKGPGATLECGHLSTGSIASIGDRPMCFACKTFRVVTKEWAR